MTPGPPKSGPVNAALSTSRSCLLVVIVIDVNGRGTMYMSPALTTDEVKTRLVGKAFSESQQQTGNKLATVLSPIQDTCRRRQVDTTCIRLHCILDLGVNAT